MKIVLGCLAALLVIGCNTDENNGCWTPDQTGSVGGGPVIGGPTGGIGEAPPKKPAGASGGGTPCGDQRYANCKIAGASAPFNTWSGFVDSLPEAVTKCQSYANTHGGGTCSEPNCSWEPEAGTSAKWTCTGPVYNCTGCKDKDCSFTGSCASAKGSGSTEAKARKDAGWDCTAQLDERSPGMLWKCPDVSALTCTDK